VRQKKNVNVDEPLFRAAAKGDLDEVRRRIAAGADVDAGSGDKYPPLIVAAGMGRLHVVRELIAAGADVNRRAKLEFEEFPTTALISAIRNGHFEIAQELVRAGADVKLDVGSGNAASEAAFKAAAFHWRAHEEGKALLGGDSTPLLRERHRNASNRWLQFLRDAISKGARISASCLGEAIKLRHEELALLLIEAGVDPNVTGHALQHTVSLNLTQVALAMIPAGADVNGRAPSFHPPLLLAVANGNAEITRALLAAGAEVNVRDDVMVGESKVPNFIVESENSIMLNTAGILSDPLLARSATSLIVATRRGDLAIVKELLAHGADANLPDQNGKTALDWATELGHDEIARTLRT